jgi:hypothetical protein
MPGGKTSLQNISTNAQKQNDKTTKNKISNIKYTKCSPKQSIRESI